MTDECISPLRRRMIGRYFRIPHRVHDISVPHVVLHGSGGLPYDAIRRSSDA